MKISLLIAILFSVFVVFAFRGRQPDNITRIGCTELNGAGCVCHSVEEDSTVHVWIAGPDTVFAGDRVLYKMYMYGGPAQAGGYNVACRDGVLDTIGNISVWDFRAPNELTQAYPLPFSSVNDTVVWPFIYKGNESYAFDTLYSTGLSLLWDSIPDFHDRWGYGPKKRITVLKRTTSIEDANFNNTPKDFILEQNYPNPFNPTTKISFTLPHESKVLLKVYNLLGENISVIYNGLLNKGKHEFNFDAQKLTSGIYIYKLDAVSENNNLYSFSKKMVLAK